MSIIKSEKKRKLAIKVLVMLIVVGSVIFILYDEPTIFVWSFYILLMCF